MRIDLIIDADQKRDAKRDKSLASKVSQSENPEIDENMGYFTHRFQKIMSERGGFMKKENHDSATSSSEVCYKCDQPGHSIRDCPMHKVDHKEYLKTEEGTHKKGDRSVTRQVKEKLFSRR
ncbi:uncharacterized protein LOC125861530 [Solanum stenotomum]|uniref:uncharacterized protein LOC125861530 n=1 Tax=Solanum stenotomum TaxID=172797 RepID=UPI0020D106B6|nr:uncharacterized protein LOC125861530 [Solanum stenotomum]